MARLTNQQRIKSLITETVTLLCRNGLDFESEFSVEGLIGITVDQKEVLLVSIKETVNSDSKTLTVKNVSQMNASSCESVALHSSVEDDNAKLLPSADSDKNSQGRFQCSGNHLSTSNDWSQDRSSQSSSSENRTLCTMNTGLQPISRNNNPTKKRSAISKSSFVGENDLGKPANKKMLLDTSCDVRYSSSNYLPVNTPDHMTWLFNVSKTSNVVCEKPSSGQSRDTDDAVQDCEELSAVEDSMPYDSVLIKVDSPLSPQIDKADYMPSAHMENIYTYASADQIDSAFQPGDWRQTTRNLMSIIFTEEELRDRTVTGRVVSNAPARHALDPDMVQSIIDFVQHRFQEVTRREIVDKMSQKLKNGRYQGLKRLK